MKKVFFGVFVILVLLANSVVAEESIFLHQDTKDQGKYLIMKTTDTIQVVAIGIDLKNYGQPDNLINLAYNKPGQIAQVTISATTFAFKADWPSDPWPYEYRAVVQKTLFAKKEAGKIIFFEKIDSPKEIAKVSWFSLLSLFGWFVTLFLIIPASNKKVVNTPATLGRLIFVFFSVLVSISAVVMALMAASVSALIVSVVASIITLIALIMTDRDKKNITMILVRTPPPKAVA